jgi:hypothetical protein
LLASHTLCCGVQLWGPWPSVTQLRPVCANVAHTPTLAQPTTRRTLGNRGRRLNRAGRGALVWGVMRQQQSAPGTDLPAAAAVTDQRAKQLRKGRNQLLPGACEVTGWYACDSEGRQAIIRTARQNKNPGSCMCLICSYEPFAVFLDGTGRPFLRCVHVILVCLAAYLGGLCWSLN